MRYLAIALAFVCGLFAATRSEAAVTINIDLSSQTMRVQSGASGENHVWSVSSARSGFRTPHGSFRPYSLQRMHYSKKYHNSPMPHSIFFLGGYAIHGTYSVAQLGRPASHGCIRLAPANAARLFAMVQQEGALISIGGTPPGGKTLVAKAHKKGKTHFAKAGGKHKMKFAAHKKAAHPLAYAPVKRTAPVKAWQHAPAAF